MWSLCVLVPRGQHLVTASVTSPCLYEIGSLTASSSGSSFGCWQPVSLGTGLLPSPGTEAAAIHRPASHCVGAGVLNSGPHACTGNTSSSPCSRPPTPTNAWPNQQSYLSIVHILKFNRRNLCNDYNFNFLWSISILYLVKIFYTFYTQIIISKLITWLCI